MNANRPGWRYGLTAAVTLALLGLLCGQLGRLHLGPNEALHAKALRMRRARAEERPAPRGRILDRNGDVLALDLAGCHVVVNPANIRAGGHRDFIARHLARLLELDLAFVQTQLDRPRQYARLVMRAPSEKVEPLRRLGLPAVDFEELSLRHYPHGALMAHTLGFTNYEGVGSLGVEQRYDRFLRSAPGLILSEHDGRRRVLYERRYLELTPRPGATVELTIDHMIQYILERELDRMLADSGAAAVWGAVQHVRTGEILAMASRPAFDLNEFRHTDQEARRNRVISDNYEPGSTLKIVTLAAALNEGMVTPADVLDCENGWWMHRGRPLRDYSPHGLLSVAEIVKYSSNIGTAKIALGLGEERLERYLRAFGMGQPTGIDLSAEEAGILHPRAQWSGLSLSRMAIGHGIAVTALQMLNAMSCVANGGLLPKPYVVARVVSPEGHVLYRAEPEIIRRVISAEAAAQLRDLLCLVMEPGGTGARGAPQHFRAGGKTGTAQKVLAHGGYAEKENIASFVGFAPAEDPQLAIIIVADNPQPVRTGGRIAAPAFREVTDQALRYLATRDNRLASQPANPPPRKETHDAPRTTLLGNHATRRPD